jgi:uncharacterized protein (TIGR03435 family)
MVAGNASLRALIATAFEIRDFQLIGVAPWMASQRFDIEAKAPASQLNPSYHEINLMTQTLLKDRFRVAVHRETRELPIYTLTVAKTGAKLAPAKAGECWTPTPGVPPTPPAPGEIRRPCGGFETWRNRLSGGGVTTMRLAVMLSNILNRTVIDKTGIEGTFDITLLWTPDESFAMQIPDAPGQANDPAGPSLFTAVQEQLGLKVESARGPVEVLVIDHAAPPSEN